MNKRCTFQRGSEAAGCEPTARDTARHETESRDISHCRSSDASRRSGTDGNLIQTEQALPDTRLQISAAPKSTTTGGYSHDGKVPTFTGEHKDWPEWSFKFTVCVILANPKSIGAPRWAAIEESLHQGGCALPCHCCAKEAPW